MTVASILTFLAGIVSHKLWRAAWLWRRMPAGRALRAEFAPPDEAKSKRVRPPSVTEIA